MPSRRRGLSLDPPREDQPCRISRPISPCSTTSVDFLDRFAAAAADGFAGVEYPVPLCLPKEELAARAEGAQAHPGAAQPAGRRLGRRASAASPAFRAAIEEFRAGVATAIEYATALGCKQLNCLAGNPPKDVPAAELRRTFVENLRMPHRSSPRPASSWWSSRSTPATSRASILNKSAQAIAIMDEVGSDNLYLQYDFYHMQIMEGDLDADLPPAQGPDRATCRSPTIRAATSPARARSTIRSSSRMLDAAGLCRLGRLRVQARGRDLGRPRLVRPLRQKRRLNRGTAGVARMKVGFIGLGIMGKPMALNLENGGHELYLFIAQRRAAGAARRRRRSPAARPRRWPSRPR